MKDSLKRHREPLLYLLFGVLTTAVSYAAYLLLRAALPALPRSLLSAAADLLAILFAYLTNRRWVFESRARGRSAVLREMASFFGSRALTLVLGAGIVLVAADLLGCNDLLVKLAANGIVIVLNYLLSKFWVFRRTIGDEVEERMDAVLEGRAQTIQRHLDRNAAILNSLAVYTQTASRDVFTSGVYLEYMAGILSTNPSTLGCGVWFEPYAHDGETRYFGKYFYREDGDYRFTDEYNTEAYDYPTTDWYLAGAGAAGSSPAWTEPFYDPVTGITMITCAKPFYDENGALRGVCSADMDVAVLEQIVRSARVGESGRALLINGDGTYIAHWDDSRSAEMNILRDEDAVLAELGERMLSGASGSLVLRLDAQRWQVHYQALPECDWVLAVLVSERELYRESRRLAAVMWGIAAAALAAITLAVFRLSRYLRGIIHKINSFSARAADGDLSERLELAVYDEFGSIADNINVMMSNMERLHAANLHMVKRYRKLIATIGASAQEVSQGSKNIVGAAASSAEDSADQAATIQEIGDSVGGIHALADRNARSTREAAALVETVQKTAWEGDEKMRQMVRAVQDIAQAHEAISGINAVIDEIALQTNLLALNAAVEASHAGRFGSGFAVVAQEVRELAAKCAREAKNAGELIEQAVLRTQLGHDIAGEAARMFRQIVDEVSYSAEILGQIAVASDEQATALSAVNRQMDHIRELARRHAAVAEHTTGLAEDMMRRAEELSRLALETDVGPDMPPDTAR